MLRVLALALALSGQPEDTEHCATGVEGCGADDEAAKIESNKYTDSTMAKLLDSAKATIVSFDAVFPEPYHLVDDKIAEIKDLLPEYSAKASAGSLGTVHLALADLYHKVEAIDEFEKGTQTHLKLAVRATQPTSRKTCRSEPQADLHGNACWSLSRFLWGKTHTTSPEMLDLLECAHACLTVPDDARYKLAELMLEDPGVRCEASALLDQVSVMQLTEVDRVDAMITMALAKERCEDIVATRAVYKEIVDQFKKLKKHERRDKVSAETRWKIGLSHFQYCRLLLLDGRAEQAAKEAAKGLKLFPDVYILWNVRAAALSALGNHSDALAVHRQAAAALETDVRSMRSPGETPWWQNEMAVHHMRTMAQQAVLVRNMADWALSSLAGGRPSPVDDVPPAAREGPLSWSNGDWPTGRLELNISNIDRCNIDRRTDLTKEDFLAEYVDRNLPVIMRGLLTEWPALRTWNRKAFVEKYGKHKVGVRQAGDIAYDNQRRGKDGESLSGSHVTLATYVEQLMQSDDGGQVFSELPYHLDKTLQEIPALKEDFDHLDHFDEPRFSWGKVERDAKALTYFGPAGSGVGIHEHTNAWNALVFGEKKWVLFPTMSFFGYQGGTMDTWFRERLPKYADVAYECVQQPGEVLYIPTDYLHMTLNLKASVGIAVEVGNDRDLFGKVTSTGAHAVHA